MTTRYGGHQYEFLSTRMEERDRCFAIDTQPSDHSFLVTYVDQNTIRNQESHERETTYLSNHRYVPDLNINPVALVQNGCSVEGQDNAILLRSTQVEEEATLVSNGCYMEGQDNATLLRSTHVVNEAALVLNGSCVEGDQDNAISSRSAEVVEEATLVSNGCSVEGQDNATFMRSTEVVNEAALVKNGSCVEGQDNATLSRSTEVVKKPSLAQDGRFMESEDNTTSFRSVEVVKEAALVQNECFMGGEDNATPSRSVDQVVKEAALEQNECFMEGEDNATPSRSVDQVVKEAALVQNECFMEVEDATLSRSVEVIDVEGDDEANASEPIEAADKEQFRQNPNTRKENPCVMIRISKDYFNQETSCGRENLCESVAPSKRKARIVDVDEGDHGIIKRAFVRIDNRQLCRRLMRPGNDRLAIHHNKVQILVPIYDEANKMTKEKVYDYQNQDVGVESSEKHDVKEEHDHHSIRTHQCSGCSVRFKKKSGRHHEEGGGEGSEMTHSVEILDIAPLVEKGFVSPFVSSKKFHTTMVDEESPEEEGRGGPTASDVFREEVLRIFRTPFNYEEYKELREAIKVGNYLAHHQDVKRKLKTFRHKRGKCLNILRGFFYWLQNLTREGSFQPWTDRQCLAVEPPRS